MPTYTVHAPAGRLSARQKEQLAKGITNAHNQFTGAQTFFAQVMFVDVAQDNWFIGGGPIGQSQIFLHGQIRAGRSECDQPRRRRNSRSWRVGCFTGANPRLLRFRRRHHAAWQNRARRRDCQGRRLSCLRGKQLHDGQRNVRGWRYRPGLKQQKRSHAMMQY